MGSYGYKKDFICPITTRKEYLELNISDVIGLKNHTNHLNEDIGIYRRVLSINDKLVYTYEYDKDLFTIYNYVNDDAIAVISSTIDDVYERILKKDLYQMSQ